MTEKYTFELSKKELPILKDILMLGQFALFHSNNFPTTHVKLLVKILKKVNKNMGLKYEGKIVADENEVPPLYEKYFLPAIVNLFKETATVEFKPILKTTKEGKQ